MDASREPRRRRTPITRPGWLRRPQGVRDVLDLTTHVMGAMLPVLTLPQAWTIWVSHKTEGVSLTTWSVYLVSSALFVAYGLVHRQRLLVITYGPYVVVEALIIAGLLIV